MRDLQIGFLGATPPALGGGGVEIQRTRTAEGLRSLGHEVRDVECAPAEWSFDVLHAFTTEPHVWQFLQHWSRNPCPLVVTAVVVVSPGRQERLMRLGARLPGAVTSVRMRRHVLQRADAVIAGTRYEANLLTDALGADSTRLHVIGNGADVLPSPPGEALPPLPDGRFVTMVGAISPRKRQLDVLRALGRSVPAVMVGPYVGGERGRAEWDSAVSDSGATWVGAVHDPAVVQEIQRRAAALLLISEAEVMSLAVLEALAVGTPVVLSDIPGHRELAEAHPGLVHVVQGPNEAAATARRLAGLAQDRQAAAVPSWAGVAEQIEGVYRDLGIPSAPA